MNRSNNEVEVGADGTVGRENLKNAMGSARGNAGQFGKDHGRWTGFDSNNADDDTTSTPEQVARLASRAPPIPRPSLTTLSRSRSPPRSGAHARRMVLRTLTTTTSASSFRTCG